MISNKHLISNKHFTASLCNGRANGALRYLEPGKKQVARSRCPTALTPYIRGQARYCNLVGESLCQPLQVGTIAQTKHTVLAGMTRAVTKGWGTILQYTHAHKLLALQRMTHSYFHLWDSSQTNHKHKQLVKELMNNHAIC